MTTVNSLPYNLPEGSIITIRALNQSCNVSPSNIASIRIVLPYCVDTQYNQETRYENWSCDSNGLFGHVNCSTGCTDCQGTRTIPIKTCEVSTPPYFASQYCLLETAGNGPQTTPSRNPVASGAQSSLSLVEGTVKRLLRATLFCLFIPALWF
jgi:hypothetical protein